MVEVISEGGEGSKRKKEREKEKEKGDEPEVRVKVKVQSRCSGNGLNGISYIHPTVSSH